MPALPNPTSHIALGFTSLILILSPPCLWYQLPLAFRFCTKLQVFFFLSYFIHPFCMVDAKGGIPYQFILPY